MCNIISLLRPLHWIKNGFIFMPLFFGLRVHDMDLLLRVFVSFLAFSTVASAVYIFNDYHDIDEDRRHPVKKDRALASGNVTKPTAIVMMTTLAFAGLLATFSLGKSVLLLASLYLFINIAYTLKLKHMAIFDVLVIAVGFVIRVLVGFAVTNVRFSMWMVIMTFLLALYLALAKRRTDLLLSQEQEGNVRRSVDGYNMEFINQFMTITAATNIVAYIMYTIDPVVIARFHSDKLYFTVFFVMLGIMRYSQISIVLNTTASPTEVLFKDRVIQLSVFGWLLTCYFILYG